MRSQHLFHVLVKVFASWCKTCQVFDIRYRKLANQYSDKTDSKGIAKHGRVRFAEMQYDNPNNEEMCQLLNATKLPYILMYKGSKGKVDEFQCGPGTVSPNYVHNSIPLLYVSTLTPGKVSGFD